MSVQRDGSFGYKGRMTSLRFSPLCAGSLVAVLVGCGGRTAASEELSGKLVTVEVENPANPGAATPVRPGKGPEAPPAVGEATPAPGVVTPGAPDIAFTPAAPATVGPAPGATGGQVVSPPHATGCASPETLARPTVLYSFSDGVTSLDLQASSGQSQWCAYGVATSSGTDYAQWGAGVGALVGQQDGSGLSLPFDAAARGIVGVRFFIEMKGRPVRVMLTEVDSPEILNSAENFRYNAFVLGGTSPNQLDVPGSYELRFEDFSLPEWTLVPEEFRRPFDPSRLDSLQFLVPNEPNDATEPYAFCVTAIEWVDACGTALETSVVSDTLPVVVEPEPEPEPEPAPSTGAVMETWPASEATSEAFSSAPQVTSDVSSYSSDGVQTSEVTSVFDGGVVEPGGGDASAP